MSAPRYRIKRRLIRATEARHILVPARNGIEPNEAQPPKAVGQSGIVVHIRLPEALDIRRLLGPNVENTETTREPGYEVIQIGSEIEIAGYKRGHPPVGCVTLGDPVIVIVSHVIHGHRRSDRPGGARPSGAAILPEARDGP